MKSSAAKQIKWRTRPGIPGCWGESGAYYDESWDEEKRRHTELCLLDEIRRNKRRRVTVTIVLSGLILIAAVLAAAQVWLIRISR